MDDPPLTTLEAAATIGVTRMTITRWAHNGTLPPLRQLPGTTGALLFRKEDVEQLAATRKETATA